MNDNFLQRSLYYCFLVLHNFGNMLYHSRLALPEGKYWSSSLINERISGMDFNSELPDNLSKYWCVMALNLPLF